MPIEMVAGLVAICILLFAYWQWRQAWNLPSSPRASEWKQISSQMHALTLAEVQKPDSYSDTSREALALVLTESPGEGNVDRVPAALNHLEEPGVARADSCRDLVGVFVLAGLILSVSFLAFGFFSGDLGLGDEESKKELLRHVLFAYVINGVALFLAFAMHFSSRKARDQTNQTLDIARAAFAKLRPVSTGEGDPQLNAAMQMVAKEFHKWSTEVLSDHVARFEELVGEVRALGTVLSKAVETTLAEVGERDDRFEEPIRALQQSQEELVQRIDGGLLRLSEPFEKGAEAIERMNDSASALLAVSKELTEIELSHAVNQLHSATRSLEIASNGIPEKLTSASTGVGEAIRKEFAEVSTYLGDALRKDVGRGVEDALVAFEASIEGMKNSVRTLVQSLEREPSIAQQILDSLGRIQTTMTGLSELYASSGAKQDIESLGEKLSNVQTSLSGLRQSLNGDMTKPVLRKLDDVETAVKNLRVKLSIFGRG